MSGRGRAAAGSVLFLVVAPGVVAGLVPWLLTGWEVGDSLPRGRVWRAAGWLLIATGIAVLVEAFARFAVEGLGTPAPVAPTKTLVVGGLYRYVRNPMYLAVGAIVVGQALVLGRAVLLVEAAVFGAAVAAFVHGYEEPTLSRRFGDEYAEYRSHVRAWIPRLRPWRHG